jgi:hypothetical protein
MLSVFFSRSTLCLAALALLALLGEGASAQTTLLRWHDRLDSAQASARESGKPLLVVFRCVR